MTHKEFYIWLKGFMTNRDWTVIREIDIETIQEKMNEVTDLPIYDKPIVIPNTQFPAVPVNPIAPPFYPSVDPIKPDWTYRPDQMPYYGTNPDSNTTNPK